MKRTAMQPSFGGTDQTLHLNPLPAARGLLHGCEDLLIAQAVFEGGLDGLAIDARVDEVRNGVHEGVFVTDNMAGRPPTADVRMRAAGLRDENIAETLAVLPISIVEEFQA